VPAIAIQVLARVQGNSSARELIGPAGRGPLHVAHKDVMRGRRHILSGLGEARVDLQAGYTHRTGMATRKDATFVPAPGSIGQEVAMLENFAGLAASPDAARRAGYAASSLKTQEYLDALWRAVSSRPVIGSDAPSCGTSDPP
jgi:hypothetical protein